MPKYLHLLYIYYIISHDFERGLLVVSNIEVLKFYLTQKQNILKNSLESLLREKNYETINRDGYLFAPGDIPLLLVAHMDTAADEVPDINDIEYDKRFNRLVNYYGLLGGDDRCGVYAIMELLKKYRPSVLFTEDEEKGLLGAKKAVLGIVKPKFKYIIEIDRKGHKECVFYYCGNFDFMDYVTKFGFRKELGTSSDIVELGRVWDIASVNVSAGYHNEHVIGKEYININELEDTISIVGNMINDLDNAPYFNHRDLFDSTESADFKVYVPKYKYKNNGGDR